VHTSAYDEDMKVLFCANGVDARHGGELEAVMLAGGSCEVVQSLPW
jgi:hypothetical protein